MRKTALITGASSGIGKEFAKIHASRNGDLIIVARRKDKLNELKAELKKKFSCKVMVIASDLSLPNAPKTIYNSVKKEGIEVDYLINNAGVGGKGIFHEREWAADHTMIILNILALTHLTRLFLPDFVKRNSGRILNVSSIASLIPGPLQSVYFATKAYVTSFSNAIAEELNDTGVTVTALLPGATKTEFAQTADLENSKLFKNPFSADIVALAGYNGMLKGKLNVLAGLTFSNKLMLKTAPFTPKKILLKMVRKMQESE